MFIKPGGDMTYDITLSSKATREVVLHFNMQT